MIRLCQEVSQDQMQDLMIESEARHRANAKEWIRRAEIAEHEASLSRISLEEEWDNCDRSLLLKQIVRLENLANNLRNKAADELHGLPLNLGEGDNAQEGKKRAA